MGIRIYALKNGPISVQVEAGRKMMVMFSKKLQNIVIRNALNQAGAMWAGTFLPKRFTRYVTTVCGFQNTAAWETAKRALTNSQEQSKRAIAPQPTPLVYRGIMRTAALTRWRVGSIATANKQTLVVRIPLGHPVKKKIASAITFVPQLELQRIVDVFSKAMLSEMSDAYGPQSNGPQPRAAGTV